MADFKIITDSTADLPKDYLEKNRIACMDMCYMIGGETYGGDTGKELDYKKFYERMRGGEMPTTSQINPEEARQHFERLFADGERQILYIAFSSGLSGTYNSACIAAEQVMEEHPGCRIEVIDSLCASMGEGLFVHKAVQLRDAGVGFEKTAECLRELVPNIVHVFTVDDLNHLYRGGRVSKATAVIGTLAGIKPILHVDEEGHLIPISKTRGRKKSLLALVDLMEQKIGRKRWENDIIFISHGDSIEDAQFVADEVRRRFGIEKFLIGPIGPTIGTHSGPGTIALFFVGEER